MSRLSPHLVGHLAARAVAGVRIAASVRREERSGRTAHVRFECNGEWLLKNSRFVKTAGTREIENVYENGDRRL